MNYSDLTARVEEIVENSFTAVQHAMFVQQAEQKIYEAVEFPDLRRNQTASMTASTPYLTLPSDFLRGYSLAVLNGSSEYSYLLYKDVNFIREAYPSATATGLPKYYSQFDVDSFIVGPTPDANYTVQLNYMRRPESIVTASTTWLGDNFDSVLLNGTLVEAIRFLQGEEDMVRFYDQLYKEALVTLKSAAEGKMTRDMYRTGVPRQRIG